MAIANMNQEDKQKALKLAFSKIEKQFGKGAIMRLGEQPVQEIDAIPTGAINLDLAITARTCDRDLRSGKFR